MSRDMLWDGEGPSLPSETADEFRWMADSALSWALLRDNGKSSSSVSMVELGLRMFFRNSAMLTRFC